jgi:hypothetical protein
MTALLEANYVRHVVAAVNEHYSNGAAEHAVHTIRTTAKGMHLHANIPKKYWCCAMHPYIRDAPQLIPGPWAWQAWGKWRRCSLVLGKSIVFGGWRK